MGDLPRWIDADVDSSAMLTAFEAYLKGLKDEIAWRWDFFVGGETEPSRLCPKIRTWSEAVNMHRLRHVCLEVCELEHLYQVDHYDEVTQILDCVKVTSRPTRPCKGIDCRRCSTGHGGWQFRWYDRRWYATYNATAAQGAWRLPADMYKKQ